MGAEVESGVEKMETTVLEQQQRKKLNSIFILSTAKTPNSALTGVAQWVEYRPVN